MSTDIKDLIRSRAALKAKVTIFKKFLNEYDNTKGALGVSIRYKHFCTQIESFEEIQSAIEKLVEEANFEAEIEGRIQFEESVFEAMETAEKLINELSPQQTTTLSSVSDIPNMQSPSNSVQANPQINLPKLELPKFTGSYEAWPGFSDSFQSSIGSNNNISNAQKLSYLRSCLTGKAFDKIDSLTITDANYAVAWGLLKKSYDDPNVFIDKHIQAFFNLPACTKTSARSIGTILDSSRKHYCALQALQKPFLEMFPIYAVTSKLDEETRTKWKEYVQGSQEPSMNTLLDFLHNRVKVLEDKPDKSITFNQSAKNSSQPQRLTFRVQKLIALRSTNTAMYVKQTITSHKIVSKLPTAILKIVSN